MTPRDLANRAYNLMVTIVLFLGGLSLGTLALDPVENDLFDKLDDLSLLIVGVASLVWYLVGRNRFRRSLVPVVLAGVATAAQILAIPFERGSAGAFGDDIGGLVMLVPFCVFAIFQYRWTGRAIAARPEDVGNLPG